MMLSESSWVAIGVAGQLLFTLRLAVQWIASERERRSVLPGSFWYLSIAGSLILLCYAVYRRDPVFIMGQAFGCAVYLRNLHFVRKERLDAAC